MPILGLLLAFILVMILSNRRTRHCKWRADRRHDREGQSCYRCMVCGVERFTSDGKPPKDCHAETPPPSL
ncbi:hypothetical protein [Thalassovita aquimarina]|uniref:Uncharacterized protein n=1 Tax=Thalassovita aquimarina TaxID=2785917 RepID=A0ABS5HQL9_9RHOB|nr:hypothetical protein [Thalassovita aquimarina]MBR9650898.1 hypothetical protein [Thalassovita aquimarina]